MKVGHFYRIHPTRRLSIWPPEELARLSTIPPPRKKQEVRVYGNFAEFLRGFVRLGLQEPRGHWAYRLASFLRREGTNMAWHSFRDYCDFGTSAAMLCRLPEYFLAKGITPDIRYSRDYPTPDAFFRAVLDTDARIRAANPMPQPPTHHTFLLILSGGLGYAHMMTASKIGKLRAQLDVAQSLRVERIFSAYR